MPLSFVDSPFTTHEEHAAYLQLSPAAQRVAIHAYTIASAVRSPPNNTRLDLAQIYKDPTNLLFGLADAQYVGAAPTEGASYASSLSELIAAFVTAHHSRRAREDAGSLPEKVPICKLTV